MEKAHSGPKLQSDRETLIFTTFYRYHVSPLRSTRRRFRQELGRSHSQLVNDDTLYELHMHYAGVVITTTTTKICCIDNKRSIESALTLTASVILRRNGVRGAKKRLSQQTQMAEWRLPEFENLKRHLIRPLPSPPSATATLQSRRRFRRGPRRRTLTVALRSGW